MKVAGIMSGTSLDGIDVALVEIRGKRIQTLGFTSVSYAPKVRGALLAVSNCPTHTRDIARLHFLLPELYAEAFFKACSKARIKPESIQLIGCHGQTIYHEGSPAHYSQRTKGQRSADQEQHQNHTPAREFRNLERPQRNGRNITP